MPKEVSIAVDSNSRYKITKTFIDDFVSPGRLRFGLFKAPEFDLTTAIRYIIKDIDIARLDNVAYRYYADPTLWWVIAWVNNIKNQLTDMVVGNILLIPELNEVREKIGVTT